MNMAISYYGFYISKGWQQDGHQDEYAHVFTYMLGLKLKIILNSILYFRTVMTLLEIFIKFIAINIVFLYRFLSASYFTSFLTLWVKAGIYTKNLVATFVYINLVDDPMSSPGTSACEPH